MNQDQELVNPTTSPEISPVSERPQIVVNLSTPLPFIHPAKFADQLGLNFGVVGGWIDNGYLPTVKVGRYQMINLVLLTENLKQGFLL